jgi:hypothetical protein
MESQLNTGTGDLSDNVIELVPQEPRKRKTHERGRVLPTFSMIDPKGSK